jgi:hypothetical protein
MTLVHQGTSILDTVYTAGYFDQSHMTNSLKLVDTKTFSAGFTILTCQPAERA